MTRCLSCVEKKLRKMVVSLKKTNAELEAENKRLREVYEAGSEQAQRVLAKEVAENAKLQAALKEKGNE